MNIFKNLKGHFCTITHHKMLVMKTCFKVGLYKQGLLHDLSKYTPIEFIPGIIYYQGDRSPINREKELKNCSMGWLHHKGRNLHHFEYWLITALIRRQACRNEDAEEICGRDGY